MLKSWVALGWVVAFSGCGAGSETTCTRADAILQRCGVPANAMIGACTAGALTYAQCVVNNEAAVCSGLANAKDMGNAFNKCSSSVSKP